MEINAQNIKQHVTVLGWLHIAGSVIFLLIGAFVFILLTSVGAISGDAEAMGILSVVGTLVGGLLVVLSLPGILAGVGLLRGQNWGRILAIIVALLNLVNFPFGTAIAVYTFWVLLQNEANVYFNGMKTA